jgi:hypothetical protein
MVLLYKHLDRPFAHPNDFVERFTCVFETLLNIYTWREIRKFNRLPLTTKHTSTWNFPFDLFARFCFAGSTYARRAERRRERLRGRRARYFICGAVFSNAGGKNCPINYTRDSVIVTSTIFHVTFFSSQKGGRAPVASSPRSAIQNFNFSLGFAQKNAVGSSRARCNICIKDNVMYDLGGQG